jgi:glycosyltransferase involved in cell wall biosynthesis
MINVVCSIYNSEDYLENYFKAINAQKLETFNLWLINAGSVDRSQYIIDVQKFRPGINVFQINIPNCTVYSAWNHAIDEILKKKGEKFDINDIFVNVNTDDLILPNTLSTYWNYVQKYPEYDVFYSGYYAVSEDGVKVFKNQQVTMDTMLLCSHVGPFPAVRLNKLGKFNEEYTISADYEKWLSMFSGGCKFYYIPEYLGIYYSNPNGVSTSKTQERFEKQIGEDTSLRIRYHQFKRYPENRKIIAFSLWGQDPKYCQGAIENIKYAEKNYPGWQCVFYVGQDVTSNTISEIMKHKNVFVMKVLDKPCNWTGMFWRYHAILDFPDSFIIFRDTDSRLTVRDKQSTVNWIEQSKYYCCLINDHPHHNVPIMGGAWGCVSNEEIRKLFEEKISLIDYNSIKEDYWQVDQDFLAKHIYPAIEKYSLRLGRNFNDVLTIGKKSKEFIGESVGINNIPNYEQRSFIK